MPPIDAQRSGFSAAELAELFRAHGAGLAGAARGVLGPEAELADVLQDAYLRAAAALAHGAAPREPVAWLFVLTLNLCRDRGRARARRRPALSLEESGAMQLASRDDTPVAAAERTELLTLARAAIHRLRAAEREVFLLRVSGGLEFAAIAAELAIPVGTAKTRMRTALRELRAALGTHLDGMHIDGTRLDGAHSVGTHVDGGTGTDDTTLSARKTEDGHAAPSAPRHDGRSER